MGLLKHFRSRSRLVKRDPIEKFDVLPPPRNYISILDQEDLRPILYNILTFVCPHAVDERYKPFEECIIGYGCMLCDLRDLAHCASVKRGWSGISMFLLYRYVRIEAVHYCEREEILSTHREQHSKRGQLPDVPGERLHLLERTVRSNPNLASFVQILRLPFMTRETHKPDLSRAVSILPHLRYVDLPDGFFTGDQSCNTLRQELLIRCPEIRRVRYAAGAEQFFEMLAGRGYWQHMEMVDITGLRIEAATLRRVLACLPGLKELKLSGMPWLGDNLFSEGAAVPSFPALSKLSLVDMPAITAAGLKTYLSGRDSEHHEGNGYKIGVNGNNGNSYVPDAQHTLNSLTLQATGVAITQLSEILTCAPVLEELSIAETVRHALPITPLAPLQSPSLKVLYYEITSLADYSSNFGQFPPSSAMTPASRAGLEDPTVAHYAYLNDSLHAGGFPELRELYVRDPSFADLLLLSQPPAPAFAGGGSAVNGIGGSSGTFSSLSISNPPFNAAPSVNDPTSSLKPTNMNKVRPHNRSSHSSFNHRLEVYSKGPDEPDWAFSTSVGGAGDVGNNHNSDVFPGPRSSLLSPQKHTNSIYSHANNKNLHPNLAHQFTAADYRATTLLGDRPLSSYSASRGLGPQWGGGAARKSIMVGNDHGAFLAVPDEHASRPTSPRGAGGGSGMGVLGYGAGHGGSSRPTSPSGTGGFLRPVSPGGSGNVAGGAGGPRGGHTRGGSRHDLWR